MLFNSFQFFAFFAFLIMFLFLFKKDRDVKIVLIVASLAYYSYWNFTHLFLFIGSLLVNYLISWKISSSRKEKIYYLFGITFNLGFLIYFKYYDFFIENINFLSGSSYKLLKNGIPIGISFFTFQQIAYLSDISFKDVKPYKFINYILFISFFPQLIAGPIVHHNEFIPQIMKKHWNKFNSKNIYKGIMLFTIGLSKKVLIADNLILYVSKGFSSSATISSIDSVLATLSYTFQIYFDFSGYVDMATGLALFFNIYLPQNFNSPYLSQNIQDFWRRWHITLGKFLRDYIYIPFGGNKTGLYRNLVITFVVGGFWHGANWTFIIWGLLHGLGLCVHRVAVNKKMWNNKYLSTCITFIFVAITWIFFRAENYTSAIEMISATFKMDMNVRILKTFSHYDKLMWIISFMAAICISFYKRNSMRLCNEIKPSIKLSLILAFLLIINFIFLNSNRIQEFIYYDF